MNPGSEEFWEGPDHNEVRHAGSVSPRAAAGIFVDHLEAFPPVRSQGKVTSCTAWAMGYNYLTAVAARASLVGRWLPQQGTFSPKFLYDRMLLHLPADWPCNGGRNFEAAARSIFSDGCCDGSLYDFSSAPQPEEACGSPPAWVLSRARRFAGEFGAGKQFYAGRTAQFLRPNQASLHQFLREVGPVCVSMTFWDEDQNWQNTTALYTRTSGSGPGGHALVCTGLRRNAAGGYEYRVLNSWGSTWGDGGSTWMSSPAFWAKLRDVATLDRKRIVFGLASAPDYSSDAKPILTLESNYADWGLNLLWSRCPFAVSYSVQRRLVDGPPGWRTIATEVSPDQRHLLDPAANLTSFATYEYRVGAVYYPLAQDGSQTAQTLWSDPVQGRAESVAPQILTGVGASAPGTGAAYPDRIVLGWDLLSGDHEYLIFKNDIPNGLSADQYRLVARQRLAGPGRGSFDVIVSTGSVYGFFLQVVDPTTRRVQAVSPRVSGATSGGAGALDLAVIRGIAPLDTPRHSGDWWLDASVEIFNASTQSSANQRLVVGMEWYGPMSYWTKVVDPNSGFTSYTLYVTSTGQGVFYRRDGPAGYQLGDGGPVVGLDPTAPAMFSALTNYPIPGRSTQGFNLFNVLVPRNETLNTSETDSSNVANEPTFWWRFEAWPATAQGDVIDDPTPADNVYVLPAPMVWR